MRREPAAYLWDVREAALRIREFVVGYDFVRYTSSELVQSAVERQFEIIGEALSARKGRAGSCVSNPRLPADHCLSQHPDPRICRAGPVRGLDGDPGRFACA
ncbi:MAG: HepT-like ribonuclease domain-containing protein [Steroidobacteraceae bacterium]